MPKSENIAKMFQVFHRVFGSSVASSICQEGQSEKTPDFSSFPRFRPAFSLFSPSFSQFLATFCCQGGGEPIDPQWLSYWVLAYKRNDILNIHIKFKDHTSNNFVKMAILDTSVNLHAFAMEGCYTP